MGCILHVSSVQSRLWSFHEILVACWLVVSTPLKNLKVSWDDEIPNIWKHKSHAPNHHPDMPFQLLILIPIYEG